MKKILTLLLTLTLLLGMLACTKADPAKPAQQTGTAQLNGVALEDYVIVYSETEPAYNARAAQYLRDRILEITGIELALQTDAQPAADHELLVGETVRPLSKTLDVQTEGLEFALLSQEGSVALEGEYFTVAAAAYYFVETYITGKSFSAQVPATAEICTPITRAPKNYIFLIGDGMGLYQTLLFDYMEVSESFQTDGEDRFYGTLLPYAGMARTRSNDSSVTDSAAGGTALASGYKTNNGYVGKDKDLQDVLSLTELADSRGMATAVVTTDEIVGATPAAFSAHSPSREDTFTIQVSQKQLKGTVLCSLGDNGTNRTNYTAVAEILETLAADEDGFFLMYEEAHIDKYSHSNDLDNTFRTLCRFNRLIGQFMEFAFYHPETLVIITADHETGDLRPEDGKLVYHSVNHSGADVPVFAYGVGAQVFDGKTVENVQIPKTIAKMWGVTDFGDPDSEFPPLEIAE